MHRNVNRTPTIIGFVMLFACLYPTTEPLEFTLPLPSEAPIVLDGSDDLGAVFDCDASGTTGQPVYSWLRNGAPLSGVNVFFSPDNRVSTIFPLGADDTGIYQCVAEIDGQPSTLITTSSYLLVPSMCVHHLHFAVMVYTI